MTTKLPDRAYMSGYVLGAIRKDALKCDPGNKPCGKRCIPQEQKCRTGQGGFNAATAVNSAALLAIAGSRAIGPISDQIKSRRQVAPTPGDRRKQLAKRVAVAAGLGGAGVGAYRGTKEVRRKIYRTGRKIENAKNAGEGVANAVKKVVKTVDRVAETQIDIQDKVRDLKKDLAKAETPSQKAAVIAKVAEQDIRTVAKGSQVMSQAVKEGDQVVADLKKAKTIADKVVVVEKRAAADVRKMTVAGRKEGKKVSRQLKNAKTLKKKLEVIKKRAKSDIGRVVGNKRKDTRFDRKTLKCAPGNKQCGDRCIPQRYKCTDGAPPRRVAQGFAGALKAAIATGGLGLMAATLTTRAKIEATQKGIGLPAVIAKNGLKDRLVDKVKANKLGRVAAVLYGPPLFSLARAHLGAPKINKLAKDFVADPRFDPEKVEKGSPDLEVVGAGRYGTVSVDRKAGIVYKNNKGVRARAKMRSLGLPLGGAGMIGAQAEVIREGARESSLQFVAGELGVAPKLIGKKGNIIAQEYLEGYSTIFEASDRGMNPKYHHHSEVIKQMSILHAAGISHGDPHQNNVMVKEDANGKVDVKLIDFGRADHGRWGKIAMEAHMNVSILYPLPDIEKKAAASELSTALMGQVVFSRDPVKQKKLVLDFYEKIDELYNQRTDSARYDRKVLKCSPGNKQCGDRCIPIELDCRINKPKGALAVRVPRAVQATIASAVFASGIYALSRRQAPPMTVAEVGEKIGNTVFIKQAANRLKTPVATLAVASSAAGTTAIIGKKLADKKVEKLRREYGQKMADVVNEAKENLDRRSDEIVDLKASLSAKNNELIVITENNQKVMDAALKDNARLQQTLNKKQSGYKEVATKQRQQIAQLKSQNEKAIKELGDLTNTLESTRAELNAINEALGAKTEKNTRVVRAQAKTLKRQSEDIIQLEGKVKTQEADIKKLEDLRIKEKIESTAQLNQEIKKQESIIAKYQREVQAERAKRENVKKNLVEEQDKYRAEIRKTKAEGEQAVFDEQQKSAKAIEDVRKKLHQETMQKITENREKVERAANEQIERALLVPKGRAKGTLITLDTGAISLRASVANGFPLVPGSSGGATHQLLNERTGRSVRSTMTTVASEMQDKSLRDFRQEVEKIRQSQDKDGSGPKQMWARYESAMLIQYRRENLSKTIMDKVRGEAIRQINELNEQLFITNQSSPEFSPKVLAQYDKAAQAIVKNAIATARKQHSDINTTIPHNWV